MKNKYFPLGYKPILTSHQTEGAIAFIKKEFERELSGELRLSRATAPMFVESSSGLNDDLGEINQAIVFSAKSLSGRKLEVVQSLAKWKRQALTDGQYPAGTGIYTNMNAIRPSDTVDSIHSLYVDQWDWCRVMKKDERNLDYLKKTVRGIYSAILRTSFLVREAYSALPPLALPEEVTFIHSEELLKQFPDLSPEQREQKAAKKYGAVFIIGIGATLSDGKPHGQRALDYDDWSTPNGEGYLGLNGDLIVWDSVREASLELSSMGIRVDSKSLLRQLELGGHPERSTLPYHKRLLEGSLLQTIGGGIGQSRLCMLLLNKATIAEVQSSAWPQEMLDEARELGVTLF